ncbi:hypothetical protein [Bacillus thermotolerans]|uniref:Uncharacterized protein n=1 Tax=Bacillus thermotolerans TaxID=1221996 RepID=A0A0F5I1Z0_BACTR|nr:hypothetical protein [Bacillus thermotolerans]KKB37467.1 hypothetical protein QY97_00322 [Bacillus thermotolerans]KKB39521.1 hypothetical protein QY95_02369 [Bacillus thermotolerans]KKB44158.1 hypothetical protein QY96_03784 [Bacillus thermotolerans]
MNKSSRKEKKDPVNKQKSYLKKKEEEGQRENTYKRELVKGGVGV